MSKELTVVEKKAVNLRDHLFSPKVVRGLREAAGDKLKPERLLRVVMSSAMRNPRILDCSIESILQCTMQCAQTGLEPILGRAYLVPYNMSKNVGGRWVKVMECQFQPGYVGLIDLARRSGKVKSVFGSVVHANDHFIFQLGSERKLEHRPVLSGESGEILGAYAMWEMTDDGVHMDFMKIDDLYKRRAKSQSYQYAIANPKNKSAQDCPWIQWPEEMMVKTVVKHSSKMVPASIDSEFAEVVRMDDMTEVGEKYVSPFSAALDQIPDRSVEDFARDFDYLVEKEVPGGQRGAFDAYLAQVVEQDGRSEMIVKGEIISADDWGAFLKAFREIQGGSGVPDVRGKDDVVGGKDGPFPPGQGEPIHGVKDKLFPGRRRDDEPRRGVGNPAYNRPPAGVKMDGSKKEEEGPDPWERQNWINLKVGDLNNGTGLWAYVVNNRKRLGAMPMPLFVELADKFKSLYKREFPYTPDGEVEGGGETGENGSSGGVEEERGGESGEDNFDFTLNQLAKISKRYPESYRAVVKGEVPTTRRGAIEAIEKIGERAHFTGEQAIEVDD